MKVDRVTATLKYSQDSGRGAWRTLELGCEASLDEGERWQDAQSALYGQLTQQFRVLWKGNGTAAEAQEGHRIDTQSAQTSTPPAAAAPREHYCQEHSVPFKARNGPHGEFFSHQIKGTRQWCNEK
jgi:hypothetical protein